MITWWYWHWSSTMGRTLGSGPLRMMRDGLTTVSVYLHPDTSVELLLVLVEAISSLQTILNTQTWQINARAHHSLVVIGVHTHTVRLQIKCILTIFHILQLVLVQVRPAPDASIDNVRESFPGGDLQQREGIISHETERNNSCEQRAGRARKGDLFSKRRLLHI